MPINRFDTYNPGHHIDSSYFNPSYVPLPFEDLYKIAQKNEADYDAGNKELAATEDILKIETDPYNYGNRNYLINQYNNKLGDLTAKWKETQDPSTLKDLRNLQKEWVADKNRLNLELSGQQWKQLEAAKKDLKQDYIGYLDPYSTVYRNQVTDLSKGEDVNPYTHDTIYGKEDYVDNAQSLMAGMKESGYDKVFEGMDYENGVFKTTGSGGDYINNKKAMDSAKGAVEGLIHGKGGRWFVDEAINDLVYQKTGQRAGHVSFDTLSPEMKDYVYKRGIQLLRGIGEKQIFNKSKSSSTLNEMSQDFRNRGLGLTDAYGNPVSRFEADEMGVTAGEAANSPEGIKEKALANMPEDLKKVFTSEDHYPHRTYQDDYFYDEKSGKYLYKTQYKEKVVIDTKTGYKSIQKVNITDSKKSNLPVDDLIISKEKYDSLRKNKESKGATAANKAHGIIKELKRLGIYDSTLGKGSTGDQRTDSDYLNAREGEQKILNYYANLGNKANKSIQLDYYTEKTLSERVLPQTNASGTVIRAGEMDEVEILKPDGKTVDADANASNESKINTLANGTMKFVPGKGANIWAVTGKDGKQTLIRYNKDALTKSNEGISNFVTSVNKSLYNYEGMKNAQFDKTGKENTSYKTEANNNATNYKKSIGENKMSNEGAYVVNNIVNNLTSNGYTLVKNTSDNTDYHYITSFANGKNLQYKTYVFSKLDPNTQKTSEQTIAIPISGEGEILTGSPGEIAAQVMTSQRSDMNIFNSKEGIKADKK